MDPNEEELKIHYQFGGNEIRRRELKEDWWEVSSGESTRPLVDEEKCLRGTWDESELPTSFLQTTVEGGSWRGKPGRNF